MSNQRKWERAHAISERAARITRAKESPLTVAIGGAANATELGRVRACLADPYLAPESDIPAHVRDAMRKWLTNIEAWLVAHPAYGLVPTIAARLVRYERALAYTRKRVAAGQPAWSANQPAGRARVRSHRWAKPARPAWQADPTQLPKRPPGKP